MNGVIAINKWVKTFFIGYVTPLHVDNATLYDPFQNYLATREATMLRKNVFCEVCSLVDIIDGLSPQNVLIHYHFSNNSFLNVVLSKNQEEYGCVNLKLAWEKVLHDKLQ